MWKTKVLFTTFVIIAALAAATPVAAVTGIYDYTLEPQVAPHNMKPGQTYTSSFVVTNVSLRDLNLKLSVNFDHADWVKIDKTELQMKDGETARVTVTVNVPNDAAQVAYFPEINFVEPNAKEVKEGQHFVLALNVFTKRPTSGVEIQSINTDFVSWSDKLLVSYTINNPLDLFVIPAGKLEFRDPTGKLIQSAVVNKKGEVLKPHSSTTTEIELSVPNTLQMGRYMFSMQVLDKQFTIGQGKQAYSYYLSLPIMIGIPTVLVTCFVVWKVVKWQRNRPKKKSIPPFRPSV